MRQLPVSALLRAAAASVLFGRAWQHLFVDAPFRALLWDEALMSPIVSALGGDWASYAGSPAGDARIQALIQGVGVLYALAGLAALFIERLPGRLGAILLWASSCWLILLAFMYSKDQFYHAAQFLEYAAQAGAPLLWLAHHRGRLRPAALRAWLRALVGLTFAAHGLYALGYPAQPAHFVDMSISILRCDEAAARLFLRVAGALDWVAALGLFLRRTALPMAYYMAFWGLATALARVLAAHAQGAPLLESAYETLYRLPHALLPLALAFLLASATDRPGPSH